MYCVTLNFLAKDAFKDDLVAMVTTSVYHVQNEQGDFFDIESC